MKISISTILLPVLMFAYTGSKAQDITPSIPVDPETKLITYKEVVSVTGTHAELFNRAIEWVNKQYKNPTVVTKVRNPATGLIEILHRIELTNDASGVTLLSGIVDYTLKIELKEDKYRYTISGFNYKSASRDPIEHWLDKTDKAYSPVWDNYLKQVDAYSRKLIDSLKLGMQPPAAIKKDEW
ncbi:MAG: DUF4468 domain-containing protein [Bacteroidota bacterium]